MQLLLTILTAFTTFVLPSKVESSSNSITFDTVPLRFAPRTVDISGSVMFVDPEELCAESFNANVTGLIVFSLQESCIPEKQIQILEKKGASAFLLGRKNGFGGLGVTYVLEAKPEKTFSLPSLEVKKEDAEKIKEILEGESQVTAYISSIPNGYEDLPWILFPIVFIPLSMINLSFAIHKFVIIFLAERNKFKNQSIFTRLRNSLALPILLDEIIGNIIIFIWAIDAHHSTQLYGRAVPLVLLTLDLPFHWASQVMIAFLWNSALNTMKLPGLRGMKKLRIPMLILTLFLFAAELASSISSAVYVAPPAAFSATSLAMYFIIQLSVSSHFMGTGFRLVRTFQKSTVESYSKRTDNLKRMAKLIAAIGIACHGILVLLIMLIVMTLYNGTPLNSPIGYFVIYFLFAFGKIVISFCIINVFATPQSIEGEKTTTTTYSRTGTGSQAAFIKASGNSEVSA